MALTTGRSTVVHQQPTGPQLRWPVPFPAQPGYPGYQYVMPPVIYATPMQSQPTGYFVPYSYYALPNRAVRSSDYLTAAHHSVSLVQSQVINQVPNVPAATGSAQPVSIQPLPAITHSTASVVDPAANTTKDDDKAETCSTSAQTEPTSGDVAPAEAEDVETPQSAEVHSAATATVTEITTELSTAEAKMLKFEESPQKRRQQSAPGAKSVAAQIEESAAVKALSVTPTAEKKEEAVFVGMAEEPVSGGTAEVAVKGMEQQIVRPQTSSSMPHLQKRVRVQDVKKDPAEGQTSKVAHQSMPNVVPEEQVTEPADRKAQSAR